jgi:predicted dehydrogenase
MNTSSRRQFLQNASLAAGLAATGGVWSSAQQKLSRSPNEKLNIGCIGVGGQGASDVNNVSSENIVALCDVDSARAADTFKKYPNAKQHVDFRRLLEQKDIEAVTVTTPDHYHAIITAMAMKMGKHVYTQKPLTHTVKEARYITELAKKSKVATQMGTQNHGHSSYVRTVELIQAGAIGGVHTVHVITDRPIWPQGMLKPEGGPPAPATLNWDMWLGPAADRPYHPSYLPFNWRGWWDFGTGSLGDMACHLMDPVFWGLKLGYPTEVYAKSEPINPDSAPKWCNLTYKFPARNGMPAVDVLWYDGGTLPDPDIHFNHPIVNNQFNGSIWVGDKGVLLIEHAKTPILLPQDKFKEFVAPAETLPRNYGHHKEWIEACKNGTPTGSNFGFSGPMTESILLGNVALRAGGHIEYDWKKMKCKGNQTADALLEMPYRQGYKL